MQYMTENDASLLSHWDTHHTNTWRNTSLKRSSDHPFLKWFDYGMFLASNVGKYANFMDGMSMVTAYSPQLYNNCTYIPRTQMTHILEDLTLLKWKMNLPH